MWFIWPAWFILRSINTLVVLHSVRSTIANLANLNVTLNDVARYPDVPRVVFGAPFSPGLSWPPGIYYHLIFSDLISSIPANSHMQSINITPMTVYNSSLYLVGLTIDRADNISTTARSFSFLYCNTVIIPIHGVLGNCNSATFWWGRILYFLIRNAVFSTSGRPIRHLTTGSQISERYCVGSFEIS